MDVPLRKLADHLQRALAPIYVIHGDEPLLAIEAGDAVRVAARRHGCEEREVLVVEREFRWDAFVAASANLGLFGGRKLVDLRIPGGKPGVEGARVLEAYAGSPNPEQVLLLTLPRLDQATRGTAWFTALEAAGVAVAVYPLDRDQLPAWIAGRLARAQQKASPEALSLLVDRCEGNLFAAQQEIEKLALLLPPGTITQEAIERAIVDVARYDSFALSEAWLAGDAARAVRIVAALQNEGEAIQLLLWQLGEDVQALAAIHDAMAGGTPLATALRNVRVWGKRQGAMERAARRVSTRDIPALLATVARLDALSKGIGEGDPWDELREAALQLAGSPALNPA